ncbi:MAG: hypothetical protein ACR2JY_04395 [Chloroflexota bacterium]
MPNRGRRYRCHVTDWYTLRVLLGWSQLTTAEWAGTSRWTIIRAEADGPHHCVAYACQIILLARLAETDDPVTRTAVQRATDAGIILWPEQKKAGESVESA